MLVTQSLRTKTSDVQLTTEMTTAGGYDIGALITLKIGSYQIALHTPNVQGCEHMRDLFAQAVRELDMIVTLATHGR